MSSQHWTAEQIAVLDGRRSAVAAAGAGTGKTTFVIAKVVRSIRAGLDPDRILCITYTVKAADELRQRARAALRHELAVAPTPAERDLWRRRLRKLESAAFATLHSFAAELLASRPVEAGLDTGAAVLDGPAADRLRKAAADRAVRRWLEDPTRGAARARLRVMYGAADSQFTRGLTSCLQSAVAVHLNAGADEGLLRRSLETGWNGSPAARAAGEEFAAVLLDAASQYRTLKAGRPDFDDLLTAARDLLRTRADVLGELRARFGLVLLDEAQDFSRLQAEMALLLAGEGPAGAPPVIGDRLVVVGDRKQSIFRFQGADHARFAELSGAVLSQGGLAVPLQNNRRCAPGIIKLVNATAAGTARGRGLFEGVLPYDPATEDLVACRPAHRPDPVWYLDAPATPGEDADRRRYVEAELIADAILALTAPGDPGGWGVQVHPRDDQEGRTPRFGDMAILLAKTTNLELYADSLRRRGIPFASERGRDFHRRPVVRDARALLASLVNPRDTASGAAVLRGPAFGLTDLEWMRLGLEPGGFRLDRFSARAARIAGEDESGDGGGDEDPTPATDATAPAPPCEGGESTPSRQAPPGEEGRAADASDLVADLPEVARGLLRVWRELRQERDRLRPAALLQRWWDATGELARLAAGPDGARDPANAAALAELLDDFHHGGGAEAGRGLREAVDHLADLADTDAVEAPVTGPGDDVVRFLTVHSSKGLEFPVVFVPDLASRVVRPATDVLLFDREDGLIGKEPGPDGKPVRGDAYEAWAEIDKSRQVADHAKLLYVALTRARDLLVLSGSHAVDKRTGKPRREQSRLRWLEESGADRLMRRVPAAEVEEAARRIQSAREEAGGVGDPARAGRGHPGALLTGEGLGIGPGEDGDPAAELVSAPAWPQMDDVRAEAERARLRDGIGARLTPVEPWTGGPDLGGAEDGTEVDPDEAVGAED